MPWLNMERKGGCRKGWLETTIEGDQTERSSGFLWAPSHLSGTICPLEGTEGAFPDAPRWILPSENLLSSPCWRQPELLGVSAKQNKKGILFF